jgi:signal transduction histidine kinase
MKTSTIRLLFVDKDREFLQNMRTSLPRLYRADTAESSDQALEKLRANHFDVLISDAGLLAAEDGGLFRWVRSHRSETVCMILSTQSYGESARAALRHDAFDFLAKPVNIGAFTCSIRRAMSFRRVSRSEREARAGLKRLKRHMDERVRSATRELLKSNEHLNAANRAKDQFLAGMSHELRTPLTAITGAVSILRSPHAIESRRDSILEILDRNVGTLKHLLDDLLDCSRIASGKLSVELQRVNLNECVAAAVETMRSKAADAGVELRMTVPATVHAVLGNPLRLQQIAWNLIDNAIKFTPPGGSVGVSILGDGDSVELRVCDSGTGLPDGDRERIFEPFAQANGSDAQKKGGLGLGLALVRNLTEIHNGSVRAESDGRGRGSRFVVQLPLITNKEEPVAQVA